MSLAVRSASVGCARTTGRSPTPSALTPAERAHDLLQFCDGLEAGRALHSYCARARMVARDVLELLDELQMTRSLAAATIKRHDAYVAYHQAHCFLPSGRALTDDEAA
jgi:hypothetical protein